MTQYRNLFWLTTLLQLFALFLKLLSQPLHSLNLGQALFLRGQGVKVNDPDQRQHQAKHQDHGNQRD